MKQWSSLRKVGSLLASVLAPTAAFSPHTVMQQALCLAARPSARVKISAFHSLATFHRRHLVRLHSAFLHLSDVAVTEQDETYMIDDQRSFAKKPTALPNHASLESASQRVQDLPDYIRVSVAPHLTPRIEPTDISNLRSEPIPGGNWKPWDPLAWTRTFGRRSVETAHKLAPLVKLGPGDQGYFDVSNVEHPEATIVRTKEQANIVLSRLYAADRSIYHACDTEVMAIDLNKEGPVGNGYVTCVSVYSGPDFDYGFGPGKSLWIDNLDDSAGILQLFKDWFEDESIRKVWHNYGFDRHVMWNEGIDCQGFAGDTMHMARLQDTSRADIGSGSGYSLEALTDSLLDIRKVPMKELFGVKRIKKDGTEGALVDIPPVEVMQRDPQFRAKWIQYSCYDAKGTWELREKLQEMLQETKWQQSTTMFDYYEMFMRTFGELLTDMERRGIRVDAKDYLATVEVQARMDRDKHMELFLDWAAKKIGPDAYAMNLASSLQLSTFLFGGSYNAIKKEKSEAVRTFRVSKDEISKKALEAYDNARRLEPRPSDAQDEDMKFLDNLSAVDLKGICKTYGLKVTGKKQELVDRVRGHLLSSPESPSLNFDEMSLEELQDQCKNHELDYGGTESQLLKRLKEDAAYSLALVSATTPNNKNAYETIMEALEEMSKDNEDLRERLNKIGAKQKSLSNYLDVTITSIGMEPKTFTNGGAPSVTTDVIKTLAGDPFRENPKWGTAIAFFDNEQEGQEACKALYSLGAIGSIDTMITTFFSSLQTLVDEQSRVHCALNLNTQTGRLSSRRPNLQNQPALEKDTYKIRKAFQSSPGNNLIVADYGQLELRLLASMTNCESMIQAFKAGGDFHSRTAMDMYDYVKKAIDDGECLLEWDYEKGSPPKPLLKDRFASERRQAKTLNFSIAYGKTAFGLSKDWGISTEAAKETVEKWYAARPEVRDWQHGIKQWAHQTGWTRTIMGRYRHIPDAKLKAELDNAERSANIRAKYSADIRAKRGALSHAERAAINTPIQGGAADVAMMAMIKINESVKLKRLGWILLLQIHDEVILEGPQETAEEAFEEVIQCMQHPWVLGLKETAVPLLVDGSYTYTNWYEAK